MRLFLPVSFLRIMRTVNFSSVIVEPVTCSPAFKVALWLGGLSNVFVGIFSGTWWPFFTAVAISLHVRLPVPLGMVPPIFDATGNAFVTSLASAIGTITLLLAYFYKNPTWLVSSLFFFGKSLSHHSDMASIRQKFRALEIHHKLSSMPSRIYPPMPLLVRAHPYFLRLYRDVDLGGGVRIRRIKPTTASIRQFSSSIDFWYRENTMSASSREKFTYFTEPLIKSPLAAATKATYGTEKKPLFFFIHGGGWKGGGSRRHTQPALLQRLVLNGWAVVACNYRKREWPQHLDDCYNALQYLISDAESLNIDVSRIVISGASAGGQLAALLHARLRADALAAKKDGPVSVAMVLFYPAIDPADDTNFTASFPFDLPFIKAKCGQSLMHWFFERAILNDDSSKWLSASPLRQLAKDSSLVDSWPPTMIIHGMLDGIVPVEHSLYFLSSLVAGSSHHSASRNLKLEGIGNTNTAALNVTENKKHDEKDVKELRRRDEDEKQISESKVHQSEAIVPPCKDTQWAMREQDAIVTLPGAKHSFEAVGGEVVDIVCDGVMNWLSKVK